MKILSKPTANKNQLKIWAKSKNDNKEFVDLVDIYYDKSLELGINPVVSFSQFAHETGFLYKVKSSANLDSSYHNPCGLKVSKGGGDFDKNAHMKFDNWNDGISAHLDHLALYAGVKGFPKSDTLDPRHFPYLFGTATTVASLSTKWAPSLTYGQKIMNYIYEIQSIEVKNEKEPDEWAKESWIKAVELGLFDGSRPKDNITRQEVANIIIKLYKM